MLRVDVTGDGPDLVMLHGWGMHSAIWSDWAARLSASFRVHCVDLPGHGLSDPVNPSSRHRPGLMATAGQNSSLQTWCDEIVDRVPADACWLGWSLGGLMAQYVAACYPKTTRALVLVASTPKFVATDDWPHGVRYDVFEQFADQLEDDGERTLTRFLALQVRGAEDSAGVLRQLRTRMRERPLARDTALREGLDLLRFSDLRQLVSASQVSRYWLLGDRDTLVSPAVANGETRQIIQGAGHAPFLSHPDVCTTCVEGWLLSERNSKHAVS